MGEPSRGWWWRLWAAFVGLVASGLLRALASTWRVQVRGENPLLRTDPIVAGLWHRDMIVAAGAYRDLAASVPASQSKDGDLVSGALRRLGFGPVPRGSSSRGGVSVLRGLIRANRAGHHVALLLDGPRGPAGQVKPGVIALAATTGAPVIPVAMSASRCFRFGSWDRTVLPMPFSHVVCAYGKPLYVPKGTDEGAREALRAQLERELTELDESLT